MSEPRDSTSDIDAASRDAQENLDRPVGAIPEAATRKSRRVSLVWIIPLVAAAIAGWLAYDAISSRGPTITIHFETAEGLEASKTQIKFKDVAIGVVDKVAITPDLKAIIVTARMGEGAAPILREGTQFWIVRPRVGAGGVTGLSTLVSGSYIEVDPGEGAPQQDFVGLEEPPLIRSNVPGKSFLLQSDTLGAISRGAPVYYRGIEVGQVLGHELTDDESEVLIHIFVRAPHDSLVQTTTRFWNASGVRVSTGANGLSVAMSSLQALLIGGVEFETNVSMQASNPAEKDTVFTLFSDAETAERAGGGPRRPFIANFEGSTRGLRPGAPVEVRGIRVGEVEDIQLAYDEDRGELFVQTLLEIESDLVQTIDPETGQPLDRQPVDELVRRGLRAQLRTGSLLTGDLIVDLDFHPDAPPAKMGMVGDVPVVPSVPTQLDTLSASVTGIIEKVASLPLEQLVNDLRNTTQAVGALANDEALHGTLDELQAAAQSLQSMASSLEGEVTPLIVSMRGTVSTADAAMRQAQTTLSSMDDLLGANSRVRYDLAEVMKELTSAARSIRVFADFLERHPEALLRGRR